jgi:hypothetical protein
MGFDIIGTEATSETGKCFRNNVWWWRPLSRYCELVAPELWGKICYPDSNDGSGLNGEDAKALAAVLKNQVDIGETKQFETEWNEYHKNMPDEKCTFCDGTGTRTDLKPEPFKCNACYGKGTVRPFATAYPFSVENVREFIEFLNDCGGFEIW